MRIVIVVRRGRPEVRDNTLIVELVIVRITVPCLYSRLFVWGMRYFPQIFITERIGGLSIKVGSLASPMRNTMLAKNLSHSALISQVCLSLPCHELLRDGLDAFAQCDETFERDLFEVPCEPEEKTNGLEMDASVI